MVGGDVRAVGGKRRCSRDGGDEGDCPHRQPPAELIVDAQSCRVHRHDQRDGLMDTHRSTRRHLEAVQHHEQYQEIRQRSAQGGEQATDLTRAHSDVGERTDRSQADGDPHRQWPSALLVDVANGDEHPERQRHGDHDDCDDGTVERGDEHRQRDERGEGRHPPRRCGEADGALRIGLARTVRQVEFAFPQRPRRGHPVRWRRRDERALACGLLGVAHAFDCRWRSVAR